MEDYWMSDTLRMKMSLEGARTVSEGRAFPFIFSCKWIPDQETLLFNMLILKTNRKKVRNKTKSETELTANVLKKKDQKHKRLNRMFFNWTKQDPKCATVLFCPGVLFNLSCAFERKQKACWHAVWNATSADAPQERQLTLSGLPCAGRLTWSVGVCASNSCAGKCV